ncbi:MAG: C25 family peptidase propeptide domain-containing protein [Bacteroidales bacterium]
MTDQQFYNQSKNYPGRQVYMDGSGIWRDVKVASLHVVPFNYNAVDKQLEVLTSIRIEVTLWDRLFNDGQQVERSITGFL